MASKKNPAKKKASSGILSIQNAGIVVEQPIIETLEKNYMPYAMSVIISRAIPEIDGFKPSHRKILYTMYKMGLLNGSKTKSANVVGQTMRLNPHGDAAIYETMVRMSKGYQALLHPYVDSKGNFGRSYSRDMAYAASRYTEVKLDTLCNELFGDIDKETVNFVDNYDSTTKEPTLLPVTYPSILVNANVGIAVGMASSICPFNLAEVCQTTIELLKNPNHTIIDTLIAPDFATGGFIIYNKEELEKIYETGRGGLKVRAAYTYDKENNCIDISQIPPTTTIEAIMDKVVDHVKTAKIREISDMRDETDLHGLKITIDLKRGVDPDKLMLKLFKMTPLEDTFSCNFNILVGNMPAVMGVKQILTEWIIFRKSCVFRKVSYELARKKEKLHLLKGLSKILLDIDKAITIVRETKEEKEVIPNLMIGFGIDEIQADYVAEIRLRQLNKEYILKRIQEISSLEEEISNMQNILSDTKKLEKILIEDLKTVIKKYSQPRRSLIHHPSSEKEDIYVEEIPDYPVNLFFTREGYFKKITPLSLRMSGEQKLKEGDAIITTVEATNKAELLFFTDKQQVYKAFAYEFDDTKSSVLGEYIPAKLDMDDGECIKYMAVTTDFTGYMLFFFENGKVAKVDLSAYQTKTKRKKLLKSFSDKSPIIEIYQIKEDTQFVLTASSKRMLVLHTGLISSKTTKDTQGINVFSLKGKHTLVQAKPFVEQDLPNAHRFKCKTLPSTGALPKEDVVEQLTLMDN